jgi:Zn-finger nucleic acid-binding protein
MYLRKPRLTRELIRQRMAEMERIEIDYCPSCRGVWLDRGELDKLIERSAADQPVSASPSPSPSPSPSQPAYRNEQR